MDHLTLRLVAGGEGGPTEREIVILVNGTPLEELARVVEAGPAAAERQPSLAGDYAPLTLADLDGRRSHFLGEPAVTWFEDGDTVLMGCGCGVWGCWPLTARVAVEGDVVRWDGFRNGHRDWDLGALGPFIFDRAQYEAAVAELPVPGDC